MGGATKSFRWATAPTFKEDAYGTIFGDAIMLDWWQVEDLDLTVTEKKYWDDSKLLTGRAGATRYELEEAMGQFTRKLPASVEALEALVIWATGRTTASGVADPFTNTVQFPSVCALVPPSFSIVEGLVCAGNTASYKGYKGCSVEQIVLEIVGKSMIKLQATIKTDGSKTAKAAFVFPATEATLRRLLGRYATYKFGPLGTEDITENMRSLKLTIDCGLIIPSSTSGGIFVPQYQYGEGFPRVSLEFVVAGSMESEFAGYFDNDTQVKFDMLIDSTVAPARSAQVKFAAGWIEKLTPTREGAEPRLQVKFNPLYNATDDGPCTMIFKSANQNYLQAAA